MGTEKDCTWYMELMKIPEFQDAVQECYPVSYTHLDVYKRQALHVAKYQEKPTEIDYCDANDDGGAVHRCLHAIMHLIEDHAAEAGIPVRFAASKLAEGDSLILDSLHLDQNEKEMLEHIIVQMENERGLDRAAAIAHMRFDFIQKICDETVIKPKESKEHLRSVAIDKILTGKYTAIPCFIGIMGLVFFLTFGVIGAFLSDLLEDVYKRQVPAPTMIISYMMYLPFVSFLSVYPRQRNTYVTLSQIKHIFPV